MNDYSVTSPSHLSPAEPTTGDMVNESYEPDAVEDAVIDVLRREGRANPYLIREATDELSRQQINAALGNLTAAGWCRKVTRGLYEYVEDPRVGTDSEHAQRPETNASAGPVSRARAALAGWDPDDANSQQARAATVAVVGWLADTGAWQTRSEIVAWLETSAVASEYATSTKWRKFVAPGLRELRDAHGLVEQVRNKGWRVVEDGDEGYS